MVDDDDDDDDELDGLNPCRPQLVCYGRSRYRVCGGAVLCKVLDRRNTNCVGLRPVQ
jgi:hypothetical protein